MNTTQMVNDTAERLLLEATYEARLAERNALATEHNEGEAALEKVVAAKTAAYTRGERQRGLTRARQEEEGVAYLAGLRLRLAGADAALAEAGKALDGLDVRETIPALSEASTAATDELRAAYADGLELLNRVCPEAGPAWGRIVAAQRNANTAFSALKAARGEPVRQHEHPSQNVKHGHPALLVLLQSMAAFDPRDTR